MSIRLTVAKPLGEADKQVFKPVAKTGITKIIYDRTKIQKPQAIVPTLLARPSSAPVEPSPNSSVKSHCYSARPSSAPVEPTTHSNAKSRCYTARPFEEESSFEEESASDGVLSGYESCEKVKKVTFKFPLIADH